jgi:hypothetical protein
VPSLLNAGFNVFIFSILAVIGFSSTDTKVSDFLVFTNTGAISSLK